MREKTNFVFLLCKTIVMVMGNLELLTEAHTKTMQNNFQWKRKMSNIPLFSFAQRCACVKSSEGCSCGLLFSRTLGKKLCLLNLTGR